MKNLINILKSSNWNEIYHKLVEHSPPYLVGKLFEYLCKYYYLAEPSVRSEYKNVWLFHEIPSEIKEKLNLGKIDHGIDLVLEDYQGALSVVQCKFRSDQNSGISWSKDGIANLFGEGMKADYFIIFTNASRLDKHSLHKAPGKVKLVALGALLNLSPSTIDEMKNRIAGLVKIPINLKQPRQYQCKAIQKVINGFKHHDRGQLILPCGAGKTLVSLWIKEALNVKHTLVLVPSLALLRQIKNEWASNSDYTPYMCVCSEKDINKKGDNATSRIYEIGGKVSTDSTEIQSFLKNNKRTIIYSTYQSLDAICNAAKSLSFGFDLAICDEAHKTTGDRRGKFGLIHADLKIQIKKRLYMTATPRIISDNLKSKLNDEAINYLHDMSNADIYGPEFYRMSFNEAIDKQILVDYQVVAIGISDQELEEAIRQRKYIADNKTTVDEIANNYALEKFMQKYDTKHAITFHSSIKKAKTFQERHQYIYPEVDIYHVNGNLTTNERSIRMKEFEKSPRSVITNARCLTEGVDVPAIDVVYFCDPKNSKIDIVQATGRALRRADQKGKKLGYVVVPIFHRDKESAEEMINAGPFKNLVKVIRALYSHDERLVDEIREIKIGHGERQTPIKHLSINYSCDLIMLDGFQDKLQSNLFDQIINKIQIPWRNFQEAKKFIHSLELMSHKGWKNYCDSGKKPIDIPNHPNDVYKDQGWIDWGDWIGNNRISNNKKVYLPFAKARTVIHAKKFKNRDEYKKWWKKDKPSDIPSSPEHIYKNEGWVSIGDWLGTGYIASKARKYCSFIMARKYAQSLNISSQREWDLQTKSSAFPTHIPKCPHNHYKEWVSWPAFLGKRRFNKNNCRDFYNARAYVINLKLISTPAWYRAIKDGLIPDDIPSNPQQIYKDKGWISWADFLGNKTIATRKKPFSSHEESRLFVSKLGLKSQKEWFLYCKSGQKPDDIPTNPQRRYKKKGWIDWGDWLGTE